MGRIFFAGDTHGNFGHVIQAVRQHRPAAVVFLGDLQPQRPLDQELQPILDLTEIWWIHGNHDTDSDADHDHLFGSALADQNLHGRVIEIAGVRIALELLLDQQGQALHALPHVRVARGDPDPHPAGDGDHRRARSVAVTRSAGASAITWTCTPPGSSTKMAGPAGGGGDG